MERMDQRGGREGTREKIRTKGSGLRSSSSGKEGRVIATSRWGKARAVTGEIKRERQCDKGKNRDDYEYAGRGKRESKDNRGDAACRGIQPRNHSLDEAACYRESAAS